MMRSRTAALCSTILLGIVCARTSPASEPYLDAGRRLPPRGPEVLLGDRLFFETRFAQYFFEHSGKDVNAPLASGDPVVHEVPRPRAEPLSGPFRGQAMSCRHCHLGDDFARSQPLSQRTYADFSARSAIPERNDGLTHTARNTPQMVDLGLDREVPRLFHFDGEFVSAADLAIGTLTGRNMGWKLDERAIAVGHIARVIRNDSGINPRQVRGTDGAGLSYRVALLGNDVSLPEQLRIPQEYRINVDAASDDEIVRAIARLMHAYMDSIRFGTEDTDRSAGSPYDLFLRKNGLPAAPSGEESSIEYARRLAHLLRTRSAFAWVAEPADGPFELHQHAYEFQQRELDGLRIFLSEASQPFDGNVGACILCHAPPQFTDHRFHNNGVSQIEYDAIFGSGAFVALKIPTLRARDRRPALYLPASVQHPERLSRFRSAPSRGKPGYADLGVWNIFANSDFSAPQEALTSILCTSSGPARCTPAALLQKTIALFKTPSLRDLGHSNPYFHSGTAATLDDVLMHYSQVAHLARFGTLRNGAVELKEIQLDASGKAKLVAFLRALNEDYH